MNIITIIFIALGLAMDATAVSVANGVIVKKHQVFHALRFGFSFGFFQMLMPLAGWYAGRSFSRFVSGIDHWIAFVLLAVIGGKMLYESTVINKRENSIDGVTLSVLLGLSIATSIDALAVGISFAFLKVRIITPVIVIGAVTFFTSVAGFLAGRKVGHLFESKLERLAGIILIAIGIKILIEHIF